MCGSVTHGPPLATKLVATLTKGTFYTFTVAAKNTAGLGAYSSPSTPAVAPRTSPDAPSITTVTADSTGGVVITWLAPSFNGGSAITEYVPDLALAGVAWGQWDASKHKFKVNSDGLSAVVTGLTLGTRYHIGLRAKNAAGVSLLDECPSTPNLTEVGGCVVIPRTKPGVPIVSGKVDDKGGVVVTWIAPANNGNAISEYVLQLCEGVMPCAAFADARFASGTTVTGLTPGMTYTFKVAAVNAAGPGEFGESGKVIPRRAPDAPTGVEAKADNTGGVVVKWIEPVNNGGNAISGYVLESCEGTKPCVAFTPTGVTITSGMTVTGLTRGTSYSFQVAAVNAAGTGVPSPKSSPPVTPRAAPGIPDKISGILGDGQVTLSWTAPADNGSAISNYIVQSCTNNPTICSPVVRDVSPTASQIVTKLSNGTPYTFKVQAVNEAGSSSAITSLPYTPRRAPDAPTDVEAKADNTGGVDVSWTVPLFDGGSVITDYVVEYATATTDYVVFADGVGTGNSAKVTGLKPGVEYTFRVAAKNIAGQGAYSAESLEAIATARTVPGAPTATASSTRDSAIELEWKFVAPETDGGSEITQYDVEWAKIGTSDWSRAAYNFRTTRIEGLEIGKQYKFRTTASNDAGAGRYSAEVVAIPQKPPKSVTNLTYQLTSSSGVQTLALNWKAPLDTGGAPLTKYFLAYCSGVGVLEVCKTKTTIYPNGTTLRTTTSFTVTPGTYRYYVAAVNDAGVEECADPKQIKCGTSISVDVAG